MNLLNKNKTATVNQVGNIPNYEKLSGKAFSLSQCGKETIWILDSGASNHIVCNSSLCTSLKSVHNRFVKLLDGTSAKVTHIGKLSSFLSSLHPS